MRRFVPLMLALTALATVAATPSRRGTPAVTADFSGSWTFDASKSEGPMLPTAATLKIAQNEKTITVDRSTTAAGMTRTSTNVYNLDGSVSKNTVNAMGSNVEFSSTLEWNGDILVVKTTAPVGPGLTITEKWSLSGDKKTLTIDGDAAVGPQTMSSKQVFTKQ